jgi:3-hydroxyisobutyrate dehydrogenase-like beta-hydroxyacid dehydrogenase
VGSAIGDVAGQIHDPRHFDVDLIRKDLRTMIDEASARGLTMPLTARALDCYDEASRDGWGAKDATMLPARWLQSGGR